MNSDDLDDDDQIAPTTGVTVALVISLGFAMIGYAFWSGSVTVTIAGCEKLAVYLTSFFMTLLAVRATKTLNDRLGFELTPASVKRK